MEYEKELEIGVRVVQLACCLCQKIQKGSFGPNPDLVVSKLDDSPVTVADWSVQAMISWILSESFGRENVSIVAEEDTQTLSDVKSTSLLASVVTTVNESLAMAPRFGLNGPTAPLEASEVLDAISRCNSSGGPVGRHWVLDPVDGTLDWSVQAMISWILSESFGRENVSIVAEEDTQTLSDVKSTSLLASVVTTVNESLAMAPRFGLNGPTAPLEASEVLDAISRCNSSGGPVGRHWVLDPVDGTLGFVRGGQYAVALALIENGRVVVGVLGCPNYSSKRKLVNNSSAPKSDLWQEGCVMYTKRGSGQAWMQPLVCGDGTLEWPNSASVIQVSSIDNPAMATFCEPVEKANSNHSYSAGIAYSLGLRKQPLRVYSMVKYAAIARGDAEIYMKFAKAGYKEKIWDHAAGVVIVEEAGGVVTDAGGRPLDFQKGCILKPIKPSLQILEHREPITGSPIHTKIREKILEAIEHEKNKWFVVSTPSKQTEHSIGGISNPLKDILNLDGSLFNAILQANIFTLIGTDLLHLVGVPSNKYMMRKFDFSYRINHLECYFQVIRLKSVLPPLDFAIPLEHTVSYVMGAF
ncbi:HAL2-like protein [Artemisia annua]|uniref:3'(2'),5'-bisphosphate nucleotidase n=1 Tax=Artemisia annua TaxID=35608 RepID=A0A2U1N2C0_ARTAN|nr:HAL2-like protein [Artemisia annua]